MNRAEATEELGTVRRERTATRTTTVAITRGDVEIGISTLQSGSFFPSLLERRRRFDKRCMRWF